MTTLDMIPVLWRESGCFNTGLQKKTIEIKTQTENGLPLLLLNFLNRDTTAIIRPFLPPLITFIITDIP